MDFFLARCHLRHAVGALLAAAFLLSAAVRAQDETGQYT